MWADTNGRDHTVAAAGVNEDAQYCITITIRDAAGRTAMWSGCVKVLSASMKWYSCRGAANTTDILVTATPNNPTVLYTLPGIAGLPLAYVDENFILSFQGGGRQLAQLSLDGGLTSIGLGNWDFDVTKVSGTSGSASGRCLVSTTAVGGTRSMTRRWLDGVLSIMPNSFPRAYMNSCHFYGERLFAIFGDTQNQGWGDYGLYYSDNYGDTWTLIRNNVGEYFTSSQCAMMDGVLAFLIVTNGYYYIDYTEDGTNWTSEWEAISGSGFCGFAAGGGRWVRNVGNTPAPVETTTARIPTTGWSACAAVPEGGQTGYGREGLACYGDTIWAYGQSGLSWESVNAGASWQNSIDWSSLSQFVRPIASVNGYAHG